MLFSTRGNNIILKLVSGGMFWLRIQPRPTMRVGSERTWLWRQNRKPICVEDNRSEVNRKQGILSYLFERLHSLAKQEIYLHFKGQYHVDHFYQAMNKKHMKKYTTHHATTRKSKEREGKNIQLVTDFQLHGFALIHSHHEFKSVSTRSVEF